MSCSAQGTECTFSTRVDPEIARYRPKRRRPHHARHTDRQKVTLVTGGASGIGRATALTFAPEGAKLVIADMNEEGGQQTVHMITE